MDVTHLELRRSKILQITVNTYVATAIPVSSGLIVKRNRLGLSPATIRNILAELERYGYVLQPHVSAGRVPTDKGYRYYVDSLMSRVKLMPHETEEIRQALRSIGNEVQEVLPYAIEVIAEFTGNAGFAYMPGFNKSYFQRIELIPVRRHTVLVVLITTCGLVKDALIKIDDDITSEEVSCISRFLNEELAGIMIAEIKDHLMRRSLEVEDAFYYLIKNALLLLQRYLETTSYSFLVRGMSNVLQQPEFHDDQRRARFLSVIEQRDELIAMLDKDMAHDAVSVHIGEENPIETLRECTCISYPYRIGNVPVGVLGVIGPTRMDYGRSCAVIHSIAGEMSMYLEELL